MIALLDVYQLMEAKQIQIAIGHDDYDDLVRKLYRIQQDDEFMFHTGGWADPNNWYYPGYDLDFDWIQDENTRTIAENAPLTTLPAVIVEVKERVRRHFNQEDYDSEYFWELWESAMYDEWSAMFEGTED